jgi:hypothetical protein
MTPRCEHCGSETVCGRCRGGDRAEPTAAELAQMADDRVLALAWALDHRTYFPRRLIHVEAGTPAEVVAAWKRLARQEEQPS